MVELFSRIKSWVENHPYLTGGVVLGLVVLFFALDSSSGSGSSSTDTTSLQQAQLASATDLQNQQDQADEQAAQLQEQYSEASLAAASQDTMAQLSTNATIQGIVSQQESTDKQNDDALQLGLAQIGGQTSVATIQAQENETIAGIQGQILEEQYADQLSAQQAIASAQTSQSNAQNTFLNNVLTFLSGFTGSGSGTTTSGGTPSTTRAGSTTPSSPIRTRVGVPL